MQRFVKDISRKLLIVKEKFGINCGIVKKDEMP